MALTGQQITSGLGSVETDAGSIVQLTGVGATFAIGAPLVYSQIDTTQNANYNQIDDSQTPSFAGVDSSQTPSFVAVSTSQTPSYSEVSTSQTPVFTEIEAGRDAA